MQQRVRTRALKAETSLLVSRPRRICRLPSRFDDHSISPSKYIPLQPANASTPIQQNKVKSRLSNANSEANTSGKKQTTAVQLKKSAKVVSLQKKINKDSSLEKSSPDSNNNAKTRSTRAKKAKAQPQTSIKASPKQKTVKKSLTLSPKSTPTKKISPKQTKTSQLQPQSSILVSPQPQNNSYSIKKFFNRTSPQTSPIKKISPKLNNKRIVSKNHSFKVLGGKQRSQGTDKDDLDIYEFTFDPSEEPEPVKKKRKRPVTKKPASASKPKSTVTYKTTYDQNISKALLALKKAVKPSKVPEPAKLPQIQEISDEVVEHAGSNTGNHVTLNDTGKNSVHGCNYPSIRVEDIAADIEPSIDHGDDINYSPVNSPHHESPSTAPCANLDPRQSPERPPNNDPLNLQEDLSFFDDVPVASSSMNMSVRHPLASPWRVEFGSLPIKWHSNTYVKPNMTPAVESSFICSEDSNKKKHVYTNIVPEANDSLPEIASNTPNLKQTSIISFIKEVAERKAKKKRGRSVSPSKASALFDNIDVNVSHVDKGTSHTSNKDTTPNTSSSGDIFNKSDDTTKDNQNSKEEQSTRKRKNDENICSRPAKSPRKEKDKDITYFGFDDSENQEQENISPVKIKSNVKGRSKRQKARGVLQEINGPTRLVIPGKSKTTAPTEEVNNENNQNIKSPSKVVSSDTGRSMRTRSRAVLKEINAPAKTNIPVAAKSKTATSSEAANTVFAELESAADAPMFPEKNVEVNVTNIEDPSINDDSESVHLFEDIEFIHHLKPTRKSYGKAKKVTFHQRSTSDSESAENVAQNNDSSYEDDFGDFTFELPNIQEKKKTKKKKSKKLMSKKEEKEAEAWAAGFNSMCEEIEDFPLVVE